MADLLYGIEEARATAPTSQVYKVTHDSTGKRLPLMKRSFMSFTYGDKAIEDWNLIATIDNNRMQKNVYAQFEDLTTTYDVIDGQFYWGSHFLNHQFDFNLATDGITEQQLNDFKNWFRPGIARELVLSEAPNRAIMARLATPPIYSFLPFEEKTKIKISGLEYTTSTTMYKGNIVLSFVSDSPFWYSRTNILTDDGDPEDPRYDYWFDANGERIRPLEDPDALKIILEDGIPLGEMLTLPCFVGGNVFISTEGTIGSLIGTGTIDSARIGPMLTDGSSDGIDLAAYPNQSYLYYCGTAPGMPVIKFTLTPVINSSSYYLTAPYNSITKTSGNAYNYLSIGNNQMQFTTPSMMTGYNQAIRLFNTFNTGESYDELRIAIIDGVNEYYSRAWAIAAMESEHGSNTTITSAALANMKRRMSYFLRTEGASLPATFVFNSETGEAFGVMQCRLAKGSLKTDDDFLNTSIYSVKENVGDMLRSNYLLIEDRNLPNSNGSITADVCSSVMTDYPNGLENLHITYKYLYL